MKIVTSESPEMLAVFPSAVISVNIASASAEVVDGARTISDDFFT